MTSQAHPELWAGRYWNNPAGRTAWWIKHSDRGDVARAAARMFYGVLVRSEGTEVARAQLAEHGVIDLPPWLNGGEA